MIRVAILSFWHVHAKDYARQADENPSTQVTAVWDADTARGKREAEARGVPFQEDLGALLGRRKSTPSWSRLPRTRTVTSWWRRPGRASTSSRRRSSH